MTEASSIARSTASSTAWSAWVDAACDEVAAAGRWRAPRQFDARGHDGLLTPDPSRADSQPVVSFASNDYLGLATHPAVVAAAHAALDQWGAGSGASRLVTGSRPVHHELEAALAEWKGTDAAIVFPTGFAANLSVLSVFAAGGVAVHSDELNHASIIDGCRLARADIRIYPHADLEALDAALGAEASTGRRSIVVSDTVFSMDGDAVDLEGLAAVAARHGALLVLDEAHAVLGPDLAGGTGAGGGADVLQVGTLSKTLGSLGGFVAGPKRFIDLLVNRARPYIFTTAPTPGRRGCRIGCHRRGPFDRGRRTANSAVRAGGSPGRSHRTGRPSVSDLAFGDRGRRRSSSCLVGPIAARAVGAGHPAPHGGTGYVEAADHAVGHPQRPTGRPSGGWPGRRGWPGGTSRRPVNRGRQCVLTE